jgi:predicted phosphate transport protein (TIGR00153 family)
MRLVPRQEKFFTHFLEQVKIICEAAAILDDAVKKGPAQLAAVEDQIQTLEKQGDTIIQETFMRLNSTFITPIDPEDIHSLATHLDDVIDGIEEAVHRLAAYEVDPIPREVGDLTGIIVSCGRTLLKAFEALANSKPLVEFCVEISRLEDEADHIVRRVTAELFRQEKDPVCLIKLKEVYEILEKTTDFCENVADVLQVVEIKNS